MPSEELSYRDSTVVQRFGDDIVVNEHRVARPGMAQYLNRRDWSVRPPLITVERGFVPNWTKTRYWVDTPHHHYVFSNAWKGAKRKALCWAAIIHQTGLTEMESDSTVVPVEVAALGKPYVAAYLYSVHDHEIAEIAEQLDISKQSVSQYLTDVGKSRR